MFQFLYKFLDYYLGINMVYEIKSFVGTCSYAQIPRPLSPLYSIEEYEFQMDMLMREKKERKYTI
jgi:hypothetical protein